MQPDINLNNLRKSCRQTVNEALREYVAKLLRKEILDLAGELRWDEKYDHKAARSR